MANTALLAGGVLALWWSTTGLIFVLGRLPAWSFRWSMVGATALLLAGLVALRLSAAERSQASACIGFGAALAIWAWLETSFVLGIITGPRRIPSDPVSNGWQHFRQAVAAILHHELAALAVLVAAAALTGQAPNRSGLWTLLLLWALRLSAKLNLHLGVPNAGVSMLPAQLQYLAGYFRERRVSALFPVSVVLAALGCAWLARAAWRARGDEFSGSALTLLATLALLGLLEHLMLVMPLPAETFWSWMRRGERAAATGPKALATLGRPS